MRILWYLPWGHSMERYLPWGHSMIPAMGSQHGTQPAMRSKHGEIPAMRSEHGNSSKFESKRQNKSKTIRDKLHIDCIRVNTSKIDEDHLPESSISLMGPRQSHHSRICQVTCMVPGQCHAGILVQFLLRRDVEASWVMRTLGKVFPTISTKGTESWICPWLDQVRWHCRKQCYRGIVQGLSPFYK